MNASAWRVAVRTPSYDANDLSGAGAVFSGGRWNLPGTSVVYCSDSIALASLETISHLGSISAERFRFLVRIDIPGEVWSRRIEVDPLPAGWNAIPCGAASMLAGEEWIDSGASAVLVVPSVLVPEEHNILLNPAHPDTRRVSATIVRRWHTFPLLPADWRPHE